MQKLQRNLALKFPTFQKYYQESLCIKEIQCMAESLCCSPETITTLLISYTPIQNKKFKKKSKKGKEGRGWGFGNDMVYNFRLDAAAAAKLLQSCPTLCNPTDGSPPGSPIPGILQARTLERVAISFSNAWKWKVKVKLLSCVWLFTTPWTAAYQAPPSMDFPGKSTGVGCHCLYKITRTYCIAEGNILSILW